MRRVKQLVPALIMGSALLGASFGSTLAQTSTDSVDFSPNPEQCNQAPRSMEEIEALLGASTSGTPTDMSVPEGFELPVGEEAPNEVRGGIVETIVQIFACANGGDQLGALGGLTDAFLASQGATGMFGGDVAASLSGTPVALSEDMQAQLLDTRDFTLYEDGRAGVLVYFVVPAGQEGVEDPVQISLWIFAQEDGRWLLDDMVTGLEAQLGDVATPPAG